MHSLLTVARVPLSLSLSLCCAGALFRIRREHDLWLLQPANHATVGKADFGELRAEPGVALRLVNFVEARAVARTSTSPTPAVPSKLTSLTIPDEGFSREMRSDSVSYPPHHR